MAVGLHRSVLVNTLFLISNEGLLSSRVHLKECLENWKAAHAVRDSMQHTVWQREEDYWGLVLITGWLNYIKQMVCTTNSHWFGGWFLHFWPLSTMKRPEACGEHTHKLGFHFLWGLSIENIFYIVQTSIS